MAAGGGIRFSQHYFDILDSGAFIDKSMLIKEFFELRGYSHVVYHGPPRFGKSVNLDMLQSFAAIEVNESDGRIIKPESTAKYAKFTSEKLAIRHDKNLFDNHFAQYPKIIFDFNQLHCSSHEEFLKAFSRQLNREFGKYDYLHTLYGKNGSKDSVFIQGTFEKYLLPKTPVAEIDLQQGAADLAQILYKHFGRKCILFIDEYDSPLVNALLNVDYPEADIQKGIDFLVRFLRSLVKEVGGHIKRSFITGVTRVGGRYTSEINNLEHVRFLDDPSIAPLYAFTFDEVESLLKKFVLTDKMDTVTEFYDNFDLTGKISYFCPYSICQFLNNRELSDYWKPLNPHIKLIFRHDALGPYIENSINTGTSIKLLSKLEKDNFLDVRKYINKLINGEKCDPSTVRNIIMNYLYDCGIYRSSMDVKKQGTQNISIHVTNLEIQRYLLELIYTPDYYNAKYQLSEDVRQNFLNCASNIANCPKNFELLRDSINKLLLNCKPVPDREKAMQTAIIGAIETDTSGSFHYCNTEDIIHGAPKLIKKKSGKVKEDDGKEDEDETSKSYLDGIFITLLMIGVIMEFKHTGKDERYSYKSSRQALQQIFDRKYDLTFSQKPILKELKVKERVYIGVHFDERTSTTSLSYCWNTQNMDEAVHI